MISHGEPINATNNFVSVRTYSDGLEFTDHAPIAAALPAQLPLVDFGGVTWNPNWGRLSYEGRSADLTPGEARLFAILAAQDGVLMPVRTLIPMLWDGCPGGIPITAEQVIRQHVFRVRRKLERIAAPLWIECRNQAGYALVVR